MLTASILIFFISVNQSKISDNAPVPSSIFLTQILEDEKFGGEGPQKNIESLSPKVSKLVDLAKNTCPK